MHDPLSEEGESSVAHLKNDLQDPLSAASFTSNEDDECRTPRVKRKSSPPIDVGKVVIYMQDKEDASQKDDLDHFFISLCKSTRKLSRRMQNKVKKEFLEIMMQAEEEDMEMAA